MVVCHLELHIFCCSLSSERISYLSLLHHMFSKSCLSNTFGTTYTVFSMSLSSCVDSTGQGVFCTNQDMFTQQYLDRVKRIWYLSPMRAAKVQASLRIRAVSPEPSLLAHTSSESRGTFRQKARSLAPLNVWACAVKICHDGMLEDTNSLDGAQFRLLVSRVVLHLVFE